MVSDWEIQDGGKVYMALQSLFLSMVGPAASWAEVSHPGFTSLTLPCHQLPMTAPQRWRGSTGFSQGWFQILLLTLSSSKLFTSLCPDFLGDQMGVIIMPASQGFL